MRNSIEAIRVLDQARAMGYHHTTVYEEELRQIFCSRFLRRDQQRHTQSTGVSLIAERGDFHTFLVSPAASTEGALNFLDHGVSEGPYGYSSVTAFTKETMNQVASFSRIAKTIWGNREEELKAELSIIFSDRRFNLATQDVADVCANEQSCIAKLSWRVPTENRLKYHELEWMRRDLKGFGEGLDAAAEFAKRMVDRSLDPRQGWPIPFGKIPIAWSGRAVGKLLFPLLRMFEGDLIVQKRSLLEATTTPLPFAFNLVDSAHPNFDYEGTPTKPLGLLLNGRMSGLALNREMANWMEVPSTGHARRSSYRHKPVIALWGSKLVPHHAVDSLAIEWGIEVDDVEIKRANLSTGEIEIALNPLYLVHHGKRGEATEGCTLKTNLFDLLSSFKAFGKLNFTNGIRFEKEQQEFWLEVSAPGAISETFELPGTVPSAYYW